MKTLDELYKEVIASDELKKEFAEAAKSKETIAAWLKKHDCGATFAELGTFLRDKAEGEMNDDDVKAVAGGKNSNAKDDAIFSISTTGIGCVIAPIISAIRDNERAKDCLDEVSTDFVDTLFR